MKHHQISRFFKPAKPKPKIVSQAKDLTKFETELGAGKQKGRQREYETTVKDDDSKIAGKQKNEQQKHQQGKNGGYKHIIKDNGKGTEEPPAKKHNSGTKKLKLTPLEQEILKFKQDNQDKLIAIQVGYKYKFYGEDAAIVSKIINVMLIKHETDDRFNYCSIPDNRLHVHLKRLLSVGYKVGVIKQTQLTMSKTFDDTGKSKGLFERELTGVYTKATYMNEELELNSNNYGYNNFDDVSENGEYMCCIKEKDLSISMIMIRPITGEIVMDSFRDNELLQELDTRLTYFTPCEVILLSNTDSSYNQSIIKLINVNNNNCRVEKVTPSDNVSEELQQFFNTINDEKPDNSDNEKYKSLYDYYNLNYDEQTLMTLSEFIKYLKPFKLSNIFTIPSNIRHFKDNTVNGDNMVLSSNIIKNLEIFSNSTNGDSKGSLFWILNHTRTKMGERLLVRWVSQPLINKSKIIDRLDAIDDLSSEFNHFIDTLTKVLTNDLDLEKSLIKLHYSTNINPIKISRLEVYRLLKKFSDILKLVKNFSNDIGKINKTFKSNDLRHIFNDLLQLSEEFDIEKEFLNLISMNFFGGSGKNNNDNSGQNYQKIHYFDLNYHNWESISSQLQKIEEIKADIDEEVKVVSKILGKHVRLVKNLNQDNLIEVRSGMMNKVPVDWIRINATKSITRFRSPHLQHLNNLLAYNEELLIKACDHSFQMFLNNINAKYWEFQRILTNLSKLDCYLSLVTTKLNGIRPEFTSKNSHINIKGFKNPIQSYLHLNYINNDINISPHENRISIITGPNMGGKSSYIRSIGLLIIMAQIGCYLPCKAAAISMFDNIFIRMGSVDNILKGQSTFMIEMLEMLQILNNFTDNSLVLLDEIGSGTGTKDGYVMAYSILKYLIDHKYKPVILFITHFHNIIELVNEYKLNNGDLVINCFHMDYLLQEDDSVVFLYKLVEGIIDNLYGINVARLSGIPSEVLEEASKISARMKQKDQLQEALTILQYIKQENWGKLLNKIDQG